MSKKLDSRLDRLERAASGDELVMFVVYRGDEPVYVHIYDAGGSYKMAYAEYTERKGKLTGRHKAYIDISPDDWDLPDDQA